MIFQNYEARLKTIIKDSLPSIVGIFALKPLGKQNEDTASIETLTANAAPGSILKIKNEYFEKVGNSSGFIASPNGLVVTNFHPISNRKLVYKIL